MNVTVIRQHNGSLLLSCIAHGRWIARQYYGYAQREAVRLFRAEVRRG